MDPQTDEDAHRAQAMAFANLGIRSAVDGDHRASRQAWSDALGYAERHLPGDAMIPWIRSALGNSLLANGDYHGALAMAGSALGFCASVRAPAASLTMAKACLRLGDVVRARDYARQACDLKGAKVLRAFSPADREVLGLAAPP